MRALLTFGVEMMDDSPETRRLLEHLGDGSADGAMALLNEVGHGNIPGTLDVVDVEVVA